MTENEAIEYLKRLKEDYFQPEKISSAFDVATDALKEIQKYRAAGTIEFLTDMKSRYVEILSDLRQYQKIGTVEECREAREKVKGYCKPKYLGQNAPISCRIGKCKCGNTVKSYQKFCDECGIKLDWKGVKRE